MVPTPGATPISQSDIFFAKVCTLQFSDVPADYEFYPYIHCLACQGVIDGYDCGGVGEPCAAQHWPYFRPASYTTRGQAAKILSEAAGYTDSVSGQTFQDVPNTDPFWVFIERLYLHGVVSGYTCGDAASDPCIPPGNLPYFHPAANVTRGQLAKMISLAAGFSDSIPATQQTFVDVPGSDPFWVYIERDYLHGVISGYTGDGSTYNLCIGQTEEAGKPYFRPCYAATRAQTAKMVSLAFGCGGTSAPSAGAPGQKGRPQLPTPVPTGGLPSPVPTGGLPSPVPTGGGPSPVPTGSPPTLGPR